MPVEQRRQGLRTVQPDAKGHGLFHMLRPAHGQGNQGRVFQREKPGVRVLDDHPQLVEDQSRLEFQGRGQRLGDLEQRGLFARASLHPLLEQLFGLNPLADVADDTQEARPALIGERRPAPLAVEGEPSRRTWTINGWSTSPD